MTASTHILVADDDRDIRELVTFKLSAAGFDVVAAEDGQQALDLAQTSPPALAILDVMMPALSGIDVCRLLRGDAATAEVPIILLTAKVREQDVQDGFAAGADDYVSKPFSPRELVTRVNAVLARVRA
jgi:two-component system phosphate regulon response regulator PhoB